VNEIFHRSKAERNNSEQRINKVTGNNGTNKVESHLYYSRTLTVTLTVKEAANNSAPRTIHNRALNTTSRGFPNVGNRRGSLKQHCVAFNITFNAQLSDFLTKREAVEHSRADKSAHND